MSTRSVANFTRQMADLLSGGIPVARCIDVARRGAAVGAARTALDAVFTDVQAGKSLAEALSAHQRLFSPVYVGLVQAGESSGNLERAFETLAQRLDVQTELQRKLRNTLVYPAFVLGLSFLVCIFLVAFVIPQFQSLFEELGQELPWPTRFLMEMSSVTRRHGLLLAAILALSVYTAWTSIRGFNERVRRSFAATPWARRALTPSFLSRWAGTMSSLLAAGFNVSDALSMTRRSMSGHPLSSDLDDIEARVAEGANLSSALREHPNFSEISTELIYAGEEAGRLADRLERLAVQHEKQADADLRLALSFLEPALVVTMATVVGFVALAMLLPIFEMSGRAG